MPPITSRIPLTEHIAMGPAPGQWEPVPGTEIRLENFAGIGPKGYAVRVDIENQEGDVIYRVLVDGQPIDVDQPMHPGNGSFERARTEIGPNYPERVVSLEWKQITPNAGLGQGGKIRLGLLDCGWGYP